MMCNIEGYLKLKLVRNIYGSIPKQKDIPEIVGLYKTWRDTLELMPIRFTYISDEIHDFTDLPVDPVKWINNYYDKTHLKAKLWADGKKVLCQAYRTENDYKICPKRGNDAYLKIVKQKFIPLINNKNNIEFFSTQTNKNRKRVRKTRLLYISGTLDHSIVNGFVNSWLEIGSWLNTWKTNIRTQFGKVEFLRVWQSQENGYPHFHALAYFYDFEFTAIKWINEKSKLEWRVHNLQKLHKGDKLTVRERIKNAWKYGDLDIKCCNNTKDAFKDLLKYVTRDLEGGESDLTNAMVWYFRKRSFGVTKGFMDIFKDTNALAEPTIDDLINAEGVSKSSNSKGKLIRIEIFPVIGAENVRNIKPKTWQQNIFLGKDPPHFEEFNTNFIDTLADACILSKTNRRSDGVEIWIYKRNYDMFKNGSYRI